jgi:hypothetical protein
MSAGGLVSRRLTRKKALRARGSSSVTIRTLTTAAGTDSRRSDSEPGLLAFQGCDITTGFRRAQLRRIAAASHEWWTVRQATQQWCTS